MTMSNVLVKAPNLGLPSLVCVRPGASRVSIDVLVATGSEEDDLAGGLAGRLFLQDLADTVAVERIYQYQAFSVAGIGSFRDRLVALWVDRVGPAAPCVSGGEDQSVERVVTVSVSAAALSQHTLPRLFNLLIDYPTVPYVDVRYHAVYVRDRDWTDLRILQATDLHVTARNDVMPAVVAAVRGRPPAAYVNFNDAVRRLVQCCNALHRQGLLDLLVITGDLVDYIFDNDPDRHRGALDNFTYLRDLLLGRTLRSSAWLADGREVLVTTPAGEELQVPLFTLLGNHDYRTNEYPLVHVLSVDVPSELEILIGGIASGLTGIPFAEFLMQPAVDTILHAVKGGTIDQFECFGLSMEEAAAYHGGVPVIPSTAAASFVAYQTSLPETYSQLFNPLSDFVVPLGRSTLVCLDTGHDEGTVEDVYDFIAGSIGADESKGNFLASAPDSNAFTIAQLKVVADAAARTPGALLLFCHSPLVNPGTRLVPESREWWRLANGLEGWFAEGKREMVKFPTPLDIIIPSGGADLSHGVTDHLFEEMAGVLTDPMHGVDLVLSGHTHSELAIRIARAGKSFRYYSDDYLAETSSGQHARPLGAATDKVAWWRQYAPLTVQTPALFPRDVRTDPSARYLTIEGDVITRAATVKLINDGIAGFAASGMAALTVSPP